MICVQIIKLNISKSVWKVLKLQYMKKKIITLCIYEENADLVQVRSFLVISKFRSVFSVLFSSNCCHGADFNLDSGNKVTSN